MLLKLEADVYVAVAVGQLINTVGRTIDSTNCDVDDCINQIKDPKKLAACMDEKNKVKQVIRNRFEFFERMLRSTERTAAWTRDVPTLFDSICQGLITAMVNFRFCMGCID